MKQIDVLVIEDNGADRFWLEYTLQNMGVSCAVSAVTDGEQAVDFLLKRGKYSDAPTPDIIFLDVNLPKLDGLDVLRNVPNAKELPVCVLTSSAGARTSFQQEFGIASSEFLIKPVSQAAIEGTDWYRDYSERCGLRLP